MKCKSYPLQVSGTSANVQSRVSTANSRVTPQKRASQATQNSEEVPVGSNLLGQGYSDTGKEKRKTWGVPLLRQERVLSRMAASNRCAQRSSKVMDKLWTRCDKGTVPFLPLWCHIPWPSVLLASLLYVQARTVSGRPWTVVP